MSFKAGNNIFYHASGEKRRFTVYLPCYAFPIISSVELEEATLFIPQKKQTDILFLGDSITHGATAVHPSNSYVMRVARNLNVGVLNQGNSGFVYDAGSIEKVCEPKIVVTAYGINDFVRKKLPLLESETVEFLKKLKEVYVNSKIVSILPIWTAWNETDNQFKTAERACLHRVYEQYSDYIIDGHTLVPHNRNLFADEVHPNDDGFAFYGENLSKELQKIITKQ